MRASFIYRFNISEYVIPEIPDFVVNKCGLNIITGQRLREEFLSGDSELAVKINAHIDKGEMIPQNLWIPFYTSLWDNEKHNVFCGLYFNLAHFKFFESYVNERNVRIDKIIYLKVNDIDRLISLAVEKNNKAYADNTELLRKRIVDFDDRIKEIVDYASGVYPVEVLDILDNQIKIE